MRIPDYLKIRADFPPGMRWGAVLVLCLAVGFGTYGLGVLPHHLAQRRLERLSERASEAERRIWRVARNLELDRMSGEYIHVDGRAIMNGFAFVSVLGSLEGDKRETILNVAEATRDDFPELHFLISVQDLEEWRKEWKDK